MDKTLNILFISSKPPQFSAGLGGELVKSLEKAGHNVDFLTRYDFEGRKPNDIYLYRSFSNKIRSFVKKHRFLNVFQFMRFLLSREPKLERNCNNGLRITSLYEEHPFVPPVTICKAIKKDYDLVVTLYWQYMLTTESLRFIYQKLNCPIIIFSVDMCTFTGGCDYFRECRNFQNGCGCCPALNSSDKNDQTHKNHLIKKNNYNSINYAICLNTWMSNFAITTGLFTPDRIIRASFALDENHFKPYEKQACRNLLNIPSKKKFVLFSRSVGKDFRIAKGFDHLIRSVNCFADSLSCQEKESVLLLFVGASKLEESERDLFNIDIKELGFVSDEELIHAFSASNVFLSPSIDDAGPSMVNQSIMCGVPVVCFNIGTALDVITNGISGYKVPIGDDDKFAEAIRTVYDLSNKEYDKLCINTRSMALKHNSLKSFSDMIETTYMKLVNDEFRV